MIGKEERNMCALNEGTAGHVLQWLSWSAYIISIMIKLIGTTSTCTLVATSTSYYVATNWALLVIFLILWDNS